MPNIDKILKDKSESYTYGTFQDRAYAMQNLKKVMRQEAYPSWEKLEPVVQEALEMIAHKIGRILVGDPYEKDHWLDIAGYATLVIREMEKA